MIVAAEMHDDMCNAFMGRTLHSDRLLLRKREFHVVHDDEQFDSDGALFDLDAASVLKQSRLSRRRSVTSLVTRVDIADVRSIGQRASQALLA